VRFKSFAGRAGVCYKNPLPHRRKRLPPQLKPMMKIFEVTAPLSPRRPAFAGEPTFELSPTPLDVLRGPARVVERAESVEGFGSGDTAVHHALLLAGVVIVEGLDLSAVSAGSYDRAGRPWIDGADGTPARAVRRSAS